MRILLAEDEGRVAGFIAKGLREQAYAVDIAPDGEQALYHASVTDYDLIVLDVMMPVKDGYAVLPRIARDRIPRAHPDVDGARGSLD